MKRLKHWYIGFLSTLYTLNTCIKTIYRQLRGQVSRPWVDAELQRWSDNLLNVVGVHYKIINANGTKPEKGKATIIMCNHSSLYDIPLSLKAFPGYSIRMLAKKELSQIPLFGKAMAAAEFPFIDRKNRYQAFQALKQVRLSLESGIIMWIAPEGTRSKTGILGTFKKGGFITAIEAKANIIPIGIQNACAILPAGTTSLNLNQEVEIHIGPAIDAAEYTLENKEKLIEKVRQTMEVLLKAT